MKLFLAHGSALTGVLIIKVRHGQPQVSRLTFQLSKAGHAAAVTPQSPRLSHRELETGRLARSWPGASMWLCCGHCRQWGQHQPEGPRESCGPTLGLPIFIFPSITFAKMLYSEHSEKCLWKNYYSKKFKVSVGKNWDLEETGRVKKHFKSNFNLTCYTTAEWV